MNPKISSYVAIVISIVWAGAFIADIFVKGYEIPFYYHILMMGTAGASLGSGFFKGASLFANLPKVAIVPPKPPEPPEPPPTLTPPTKKPPAKKAPAKKAAQRAPRRVRPADDEA